MESFVMRLVNCRNILHKDFDSRKLPKAVGMAYVTTNQEIPA